MAAIHKTTIPLLLLLLFVFLLSASTIDGRQLNKRKTKTTTMASETLKSDPLEESKTTKEDDFRPTNPGNSPGAGHAFQGLSSNGAVSDFRPTGPGRSPGVGHSAKEVSVKTKA